MAANAAFNTVPAEYSLEIAELIRSNLTPKRMQEQLSSYKERTAQAVSASRFRYPGRYF